MQRAPRLHPSGEDKVVATARTRNRLSGRDVVFLRDAEGRHRVAYLGAHGSTAASRCYGEALATQPVGKPLEASPRKQLEASEFSTAAKLREAFRHDEEHYYVDD